MIAFVCDTPDCGLKQPVDGSAIVLPKGWLDITAIESVGYQQNPRKTLHFCPLCSEKMRGQMPALRGIVK